MTRIITGLRSAAAAGPLASAVPPDHARATAARARAARLLLEARRQKRDLLDAARAEAATLQEQACAAGYAAGYAAGEVAGQAAVIAAAAPFVALIERAARDQASARQVLDDEVAALAVALAEALVCRALDHDPMLLYATAQAAITELGQGGEIITLRTSPGAVAALRTHLPLLSPSAQVRVQIQEDPGLGPADLLVESGPSRVDARLDTRLARARAVIADHLDSAPNAHEDAEAGAA